MSLDTEQTEHVEMERAECQICSWKASGPLCGESAALHCQEHLHPVKWAILHGMTITIVR